MLELKNLTKKYGEKIIFQDTDFVFPDKGLVVLMGQSGVGKSTLFKLIGGTDRDFSGEIIFDDCNIAQLNDNDLQNYKRDCIGNIFQNYTLLKGYTAEENLMMTNYLRNNNDAEKVQRLLTKVGLSGKGKQVVDTMSGGEKQRVSIARALSYNPPILLADEPTGALDEKNTSAIMNLLKELSQEILVIVITHNDDLRKYADLNLLLKNKKITIDIDKKAKYRKSANTALSQTTLTDTFDLKYPASQDNSATILPDSEIALTKKSYFPTSAIKSQFKMSSAATLGAKNYKVWFGKLIVIILLIAFALIACFSSLYAKKAVDKNMQNFLDKNTAYDNMQIFVRDYNDKLFEKMTNDKRLNNIFYRFDIMDSGVKIGDKEVSIFRKSPDALSNLVFVTGRLPANANQIAISPSLAKKVSSNFKDAVGKKISYFYIDKNDEKHFFEVEVCGVFTSNYDDYVIDGKIEKEVYSNSNNKEPIGISCDIADVNQIIDVATSYSNDNYQVYSSAEELQMLDKNFQTIKIVFLVMSIIVFVAAIIGSGILTKKYLQIRVADKQILTDLGYSKQNIKNITLWEALYVTATILLLAGSVIVIIMLAI